MKHLYNILAGIVVNIIFWGGWPLLIFLVIMSFVSLFSFNLGGVLIFSIASWIVAYILRLFSQAMSEVNQEK